MSSPLIAAGWSPRESNGDLASAAIVAVSSVTHSFGPALAAVLGLLLLFTGTSSFLIRRPHNVRWMAISLGCLAVVSLGSGPWWLDFGIVLLCVAGWASQFIPSRELAEA